MLMMLTAVIVVAGCMALLGFKCLGAWMLLAVTLCLGVVSMSAIGLVVASRGSSPDLVSGLLNFLAPAMMLFGEVWFSLEGSPGWVKATAHVLPLTHCVSATRQIMNDGAGFAQI